MTTTNNQLDMNANRLTTTERKIEWLKNEIKDLEYVLSDDCFNRNLKLCMLQMYREHLGMLENDPRMCKDVLAKLERQESLINEMKEAAADRGFQWHDYDAGEDAWEDSHKGKWVKAGEPMIDLHDWNDVSNTKIPLNEEIFALLVDRQNPEKLRPAVIVAKMMPAKRLTWTESKEGDVLCYDVPAGNFHSCNGAQIKYWKYVTAPSKQAETLFGRK